MVQILKIVVVGPKTPLLAYFLYPFSSPCYGFSSNLSFH